MALQSQSLSMSRNGTCKQAFVRFTAPRRSSFFALHQHCLAHRSHPSQLPASLAQGSDILPCLGQLDPFVGEATSKPDKMEKEKMEKDGKGEFLYHLVSSKSVRPTLLFVPSHVHHRPALGRFHFSHAHGMPLLA